MHTYSILSTSVVILVMNRRIKMFKFILDVVSFHIVLPYKKNSVTGIDFCIASAEIGSEM